MDCERPLSPPEKLGLAGIDEVWFERRTARAVQRDGERLTVGLDDDTVSGRHARLQRAPEGWTLHDEGSKNGTFVDGRRVSEAALEPHSFFEIGDSFFLVRPGGEGEPLAAQPSGMRTLSEPLRASFELIARVAPSPVPLLICLLYTSPSPRDS